MTGSMMTTMTLVGGSWSIMRNTGMRHWSDMRNVSNWSHVMGDTGMRNRSSMMMSNSSNMNWLSNDLMHRLGNFHVSWLPPDYSVESIMVISMVIDNPVMTIGIQEGVLTTNFISVSSLVLALDITGVAIVNRVREFVVCRSMMFNLLHDGVLDRCSMYSSNVMHRSCVRCMKLNALMR